MHSGTESTRRTISAALHLRAVSTTSATVHTASAESTARRQP
jgi:hypothetical protein